MKFTWGTGIFIFIVLFVITCLSFLWYTQTLHISLVEEDYYPKELRHEEHLNKIRNANLLHERIKFLVGKEQVSVILPAEMRGKPLTGQIHVYRPSDEKLDLILPMIPDTAGLQNIPLAKFTKGKYIVKVEWSSGKKQYYEEEEIYIP